MNKSILFSISLSLLASLNQLQAQDQPDSPAPIPTEPSQVPAPAGTDPAAINPPSPAPAAVARPAPPANQKRERISITGSRIKRTDQEGPAPVQVLDKSQMEASGFNTVGDVLRELPVSAFGAVREEAGRGGAGVAGANLRGIGEEYTLVLIDGRRMPSDPVLEVVDISEIPIAMVERVEILKEGASALYGSDAVGGVINIITRKNVDGAGLLYSRSFTSEKGGDDQRIELVGGTGSDTTNVTVALAYRDRSIVMAKDRDFSAEGWSTQGNPGSFQPIVSTPGPDGKPVWDAKPNTSMQADPNCLQSDLNRITNAPPDTYCEFNYAATASNIPALNQLGVMAKLDHELTDKVKLFAFVKDSRRSVRWNFAPAPQEFEVTDQAGVQRIKDSLGAVGAQINPAAGDGVLVRYRTTELGTRNQSIQEKNTMGVIGLSGTIGDWDWEYSFSKGRTWRNEVGVSGYWLVPTMKELINNGTYNPFDPNRDPNVLQAALHRPWSIETSNLDTHNLLFTGEAGSVGGGPIGFAIGASHVAERYEISADNQTLRDEVAGSSATLGGGKRSFASLFGEMSLPLTQQFELSLAARFDDYSDVGSTTNPRLAVKYKLPSVLLRASLGTGFRAPSLQSISDDGGYGYPSFIDARACQEAEASGDTDAIGFYCAQSQYEVRTFAASGLKPEKTLFANIGAVYEPSNTFNLAADLWLIQIKDRIGIPDYNLLTKAEAEGNESYKEAGIDIVRTGQRINYISLPRANLAKSEVSGIDVNSNYSVGNRADLLFNWAFDTSYYLFFKESAFEGQSLVDRIGIFGRPRWKANNAFTFTFANDHSVGSSVRTIGGTEKAYAPAGDLPVHNEVDFQYTYGAFYRGSIGVGIVNAFAAKPPVDETQNPEVNASLYDTLGQNVYVKLTQSF